MASMNAAATTVASGSHGGEISTMASWSSPSSGVLDVTSTAGLADCRHRPRGRIGFDHSCGHLYRHHQRIRASGIRGFLHWLAAPARRLRYSVGMTVTEDTLAAIPEGARVRVDAAL